MFLLTFLTKWLYYLGKTRSSDSTASPTTDKKNQAKMNIHAGEQSNIFGEQTPFFTFFGKRTKVRKKACSGPKKVREEQQAK